MYSKIVELEEAYLSAEDYILIHCVSFDQNKKLKIVL